MFSLQNIHSLTDFKRNANTYIESIRSTKAPIVLTVNGEAAVVVQDAMVFQDLVDRLLSYRPSDRSCFRRSDRCFEY
jgi:prevent-host-death family protein